MQLKKALKHPKASEEERQAFREKIEKYKAQNKPISYIDESGFAHDMPRLYGYSLKGERCYGTHNLRRKR